MRKITFFILLLSVFTTKGQTLADLTVIKARGFVYYSDLGAKGDGTTDDMGAIIATHNLANEHGLAVKADPGFSYYLSGKDQTAVIRTDTDFGTAFFLIDDTEVENRNAPVFLVSSSYKPFPLSGISKLKRNQTKI